MNADLTLWLVLAFVVLFFCGLALRSWRMMRKTDRMLEDVDKSKLNDLSKDNWDEP